MKRVSTNRPRILLCISSSKWGGGERHVLDLIEGLGEFIDFTLLLEPGGILEEKSRALGIQLEFHSFTSKSLIPSLKELHRILSRVKPDGIHTHLNQASFQISLLRPWLNCPILSSVHGFSSLLYYALPHHLIAVSDSIARFLRPWFSHKTRRIYNGIEEQKTQPQKSTASNPRAFIFATIHPNKGQEFICEAVESYQGDVRITLVGKGNFRHETSLNAKIQKAPSVQWEPIVCELDSYWKEADFIIIPSYQEALSYVALEALARGIPVLASKTGGLKEIFENEMEGLFFEPGNQKSFRQSLKKMEENHSQYQAYLRDNPFLKRNPQFQLKTMLNQIHKSYQEVFQI